MLSYQKGNKVTSVINVCVRLVKKSSKRTHVTPFAIELHWLPMKERIEYKTIMLTYKSLHGLSPTYMSDIFSQCASSRDLRSNQNFTLNIPKFRTEKYGRGRFGVTAPKLWNSLPSELKLCDSVSTFKKQLKTFLFRQAYF